MTRRRPTRPQAPSTSPRSQNGGSADNIQPGIDFFEKLKAAGNFNNVLPTQATVNSGETPVVIQWSYNNLAWGPAGGSAGNAELEGRSFLPGSAALGSYYNQAINADAPDPAAARLWEEFIYTPAVQNLYLASGAYPATLAAMEKNGRSTRRRCRRSALRRRTSSS